MGHSANLVMYLSLLWWDLLQGVEGWTDSPGRGWFNPARELDCSDLGHFELASCRCLVGILFLYILQPNTVANESRCLRRIWRSWLSRSVIRDISPQPTKPTKPTSGWFSHLNIQAPRIATGMFWNVLKEHCHWSPVQLKGKTRCGCMEKGCVPGVTWQHTHKFWWCNACRLCARFLSWIL